MPHSWHRQMYNEFRGIIMSQNLIGKKALPVGPGYMKQRDKNIARQEKAYVNTWRTE